MPECYITKSGQEPNYMSNLVVHDPTGFWDNLDMTALTQEHTRMQALIDLF